MLLLHLTSVCAFAQDPVYDKSKLDQSRSGVATQPFKGCTMLIVETQDDYPTAFKNLKMSFVRQGFHITHSDEQTNSVTGEMTVKRAGNIVVSAAVFDEGIFFNGNFDTGIGIRIYNVSKTGAEPIECRGMKGSPMMIAFQQMESIAKSYPGGRIIYTIK